MNRSNFLKNIVLVISAILSSFNSIFSEDSSKTKKGNMDSKQTDADWKKSKSEWKKILKPEEYEVLFEHGTERAFTSELNANKEKGVYSCRACGKELFASSTKFDSGTGWPSFYQPISKDSVGETVDKSYGMVRTEVHCPRCGGHLGHVFDDGPRPTGLRYCINGVSLKFIPSKK